MTDATPDYRSDIPAFARDMLGIDLNPGQIRFLNAVAERRGVTTVAKYLTIMLASGNRAGKTLALAVMIIHSCMHKLSYTPKYDTTTPSGLKRWALAEYHWFHFGIAHEVADLVYNEIIRLLAGNHPAQEAGCPLTAAAPVALWDTKEYGDYHWIRFLPEAGGAEIHFRTTGERALGQLGKDMHGISFDEAGIEKNLPFLVYEVFHFRRLGTGGQLVMVSTPSEDIGVDFADMWELGDPGNPERLKSNISLRMSTRENVGFGLTSEMFEILLEGLDERTIMQNIEGIFIQAKSAYFNAVNTDACFIPGMPEFSPAKRKTIYLQGVDPAKSQDSAWSIVLAIVPNKDDPTNPYLVGVRASQKKGQKSTDTIVALATDSFNAYEVARLGSRCYTALDATGFGGKMFREALDREVPSLYNVEFGGTVQKKRKLLGDLRTLIDSGRLLLPREGIWLQVRKQLLGYKLEDRGIEQDAVMALVCAVYLLARAPSDGEQSIPFDLYTGDTR